MKKRFRGQVVVFCILLVWIWPAFACVAAAPPKKPNIILIYIDDLGYADLACYGSRYGQNFTETPNINRFAQQSMKFTQAYSAAPLCSPSRAAMLTGKSPARLAFEFVTRYPEENYRWGDTAWRNKFKGYRLVPPPFKLNLPLAEITLAEMLKQQGYTTGIAGKWHVSSHYKQYNGWNPDYGPARQGFDWTADTFGAFKPGVNDDRTEKGDFPQDELTGKAIEFLKSKHRQPFLLMVSHYLVHTPLNTRVKWLMDKYRAKAGPGVSAQRIAYAAFVETMDHYVGQLLEAVDEGGLKDNTVVIFTSDNGGMPEFAYNRPFRGSKWNLYEGGIRVPMLVRWPQVVKAGSTCQVPVIQTDFMATFYQIAGGKNKRYGTADGTSLLPLLKGSTSRVNFKNRAFVWHFPYYHPEGDKYAQAKTNIGIEDEAISMTTPQSAIRQGNLKYIYFYETARGALYNLKHDQAEQHDLSHTRQQDAKRMKLQLFNYLVKVKARFPQKNR